VLALVFTMIYFY